MRRCSVDSSKLYLYNATLVRVIDGDTIVCDIDLGFNLRQQLPVRLAHINAPELNTKEGVLAKSHITTILGDGKLVLKTFKPKDKFGRFLAEVYWDGNYINQIMINDGYAVPYEGVGA